MTTRKRLAKTLVVIACLLGALSLTASADASVSHPLIGSFGPEPQEHGGPGVGSFTGAQGIAVDQITGDVYIEDATAGLLYKFNPAGEPANFSSVASNTISIPHASPAEAEIAVSPAGTNAGDIYVEAHEAVEIYNSAGEPQGKLNGGEGICGVAVDPSGNIYVGSYLGHVNKYSSSETYLSSLRGTGEICNLAADSEGNAYVATFSHGPITKYAAAQFLTEEQFIDGGEVPSIGTEVDHAGSTLAVDPSNGDVYVDEGAQITEFAPGGEVLGVSAKGSISGSYGVAVNASTGHEGSGYLYASDNATGTVKIYGPAVVLPIEVGDSVSSVTSSTATLQAGIDPQDVAGTYYFQYGTTACASSVSACVDAPAPPGLSIGAGEAENDFSEDIHGLTPGTTYHYRAVALDTATGEPVYGTEHTFTTSSASSFALPDGRAYEMVSPLDKNGGNIQPIDGVTAGGVVEASAEGNAITYLSLAAFDDPQGALGGNQYIATREAGKGWVNENITTPSAAEPYAPAGRGAQYRAFSSDLSQSLLEAGNTSVNPPLGPGLPSPESGALYLRANAVAGWQALGTSLLFQAATPDLKSVVVESGVEDGGVPLEWGPQGIQPVAVLSGGESESEGVLGSAKDESHTISDDGSRVFWSSLGGAKGGVHLYVREGLGTPTPRTVQIDAGAGGGGIFQTASASGSKAFFIQVTQGDLYEYNTETEALTDISPGSGGVAGVLGASEDGSYVYFVAPAVLDSNESADGEKAAQGANNVYMVHDDGPARFIDRLSSEDEAAGEKPEAAHDWSSRLWARTTRVGKNGELVFRSRESLTGYDNHDANTGAADQEVFLYDPASARLTCVSCNPSGARPIGPSTIPAGTDFELHNADYQSRVLSEAGEAAGKRVFFDSDDALSPQDTNHKQDVYEWEDDGVSSCATQGGCVSLISRGTSDEGSSFVDASESGDNVFFITDQQLVKSDDDQLFDLYDARVDGGFSSLAPSACTGTGCQGVPAATPIFATPSSVTFNGEGNFANPGPAVGSKRKLTPARQRAAALAKALKACRAKRSKRRATCEKAARKRYGVKAAKKRGKR